MDYKEQYLQVNQGDVLVFDKAVVSAYISTDDKDKVDFSKANMYKLLLKDNITFPVPTEIINGQSWEFLIQQDSTGGHTITFPSQYEFLEGDSESLNKLANGKSILVIKAFDNKLYTKISSINTSSNNLLSQDYTGEFNLSTGGEVNYKITSINNAHTPTVSAPLVENSVARVVIDAGSSASLVDTNIGTKRPGSDDFTISKKNELTVMVFPDGTAGALIKYYSIKVLN